MKIRHDRGGFAAAIGAVLLVTMPYAQAATISRLTPPSQLFATGGASGSPVISRFVPGQRFDLQATVRPDPGTTITSVSFLVDGREVTSGPVNMQTAGLVAGLPAGTTVASLRALFDRAPRPSHTNGGGDDSPMARPRQARRQLRSRADHARRPAARRT